MKTLITAAAFTAAMATSAAAVTIDFEALASGNEGGIENSTFSFGLLDVTITSTSNAYLDDVSGGLPAGLGVCSSGLDSDGECNDPSDDNITSGEAVTLTFGGGATVLGLGDFVFRNADHVDISTSTSELGFSLVDELGTLGSSGVSFADLEGILAGGVVGAISSITFSFADFSPYADEFYLSVLDVRIEPVPLPASVLLLGGAIGGLGLMRRRRKAS